MIIDTHCHLFSEDYDDLDKLVKEMKENNIYAVVNGFDLKSNKEAILMKNKYNNIYAAIGFHPSEVDKIDIDYIEYLKENYKYSVAIGEIGLDYHYTKENKEKQIKLLKSQLSFATKYNLPVIIHARGCINDIYNILKEYNLKGVIHAYSGSYEMAREFIKLGYKIGIGGVITFKNSNLKEVVRRIDIKDIVLETDSPYLTPEPNRGKKNNPLYLKYIIDTIANVKNMTYESVVNITTQTAISLFDLNS